MPRVIVLDTLAPEGLALLTSAAGIEFEVRTGLKGEALRAALNEFDGAICRSGVKITAEALAGNTRLRAIVRAGVGTDNIDKQAATRLGIVVMNTPAGNTISTAEHTLTLMMALSRNIAPAHQSLLEGKWERNKYMGAQLAGKTLGIIGMGRIGQAVASRARALEMRVLGYDPFLSAERAAELGVESCPTVAAMLPQADYLTVHTPLTDETRSLVGMRELDLLKPGVRLINCARGGIYDEDALVAGLKSGKIGGVALDVFIEEPCVKHPLFGMAGVLCTPHLGASTEEAQTQVAIEGVGLLVDYLTKGTIRHSVNATSIDRKTLESLRGYLDVAYRLGVLLAQIDCGQAKACHLQYRGEVAGKDTKLITASFAAGLLSHVLARDVNIVNAEMLLRERGIELVEQSRGDMGAFSTMITAELIGTERSFRAAGTVFGQQMPRLVQLEDFRLDAFLDSVMLIFHHRDVPGIVGVVGTICGKHHVNIAQMAVGRATKGGDAIGVLNLDHCPSEAALAEIKACPHITRTQVVRLPGAGELPAWLVA